MKKNNLKVKKIKNKIPMERVILQADPCRYAYERRKERCLHDCCCDCRPVNDRCSAFKDYNY